MHFGGAGGERNGPSGWLFSIGHEIFMYPVPSSKFHMEIVFVGRSLPGYLMLHIGSISEASHYPVI